jgi:hypothetical protein
LYTESLFTSLTVLFLGEVLGRERPGPYAIPLALGLLFLRPVGLLLVGPMVVWTLLARAPVWSRWLGCGAVLAVAVFHTGVAAPQLRIILGSDVLCGCTVHPDAANGFAGRSVFDTQLHLAERFGMKELVRHWIARPASLFAFTRTHYSWPHNLLLAPWYLLYPAAAIGLWRHRRKRWPGVVLGVTAVYAGLVMFTCDEWSGRFLVPLVPLLLVPASIAAGEIPWRSPGAGMEKGA